MVLVVLDRAPGAVRLDQRDAFGLPHRPVEHPLLNFREARERSHLEVLLLHHDPSGVEEADNLRRLGRMVHVRAQEREVRAPARHDVPRPHGVVLVIIAQDEGAEVHRARVRPLDDEIRADPGAEDPPERLAERLRLLHEARRVFGVQATFRGERVRHLLRKREGVPVEDVLRLDAHSQHIGDPAPLVAARRDDGDFGPPREGCPDEFPRVGVGAPDQPPAAGEEADLREDRFGAPLAEEDLFLTHPDPARVHHESAPFIEESLLVLAAEARARGPEKGEPAPFREGGNQKREVPSARMLEDRVHRSTAVRSEDREPERFGPCAPRFVVLLASDRSEDDGRDPPAVHESVRHAAGDQRSGEVRVGPHEDHAGAEPPGDLGPGETGPFPTSHHEHRIPGGDTKALHHRAVSRPEGEQEGREALGGLPAQRRGEGDRPFLVHHGELGVEAVVGLVAADVPAGPGIQDDRLAGLDPGDRETRVHHDP